MAILPLLAAPASYVACEWDLTADAEHRAYWLDLFRTHIHTIVAVIRADGAGEVGVEGRIEHMLDDYYAGLRPLDARPDAWGTLTVLALATYRQRVLARHGFTDPFAALKARETQAAIAMFADVVRALDAMPDAARLEAIARGIFAGNEFDLGCTATTERYHAGGHDFADAMSRLPPRPWPEDDFDMWQTRLSGGGPAYRRVLFFVDNAGADAILGCVPLARELVRRGAVVRLAANSGPSLNDITAVELDAALASLAKADAVVAKALADGRLRAIASGGEAPLIDLTDVSSACAEATAGADLVILEGMGRSVESNRSARFTCDVLRAALIKDPFVAEHTGIPLFSPTWRFEPAPSEGV